MSILVNTPNGTRKTAWKHEDSEDDNNLCGDSPFKRTKLGSWYVTLESESPQPTDEDEESILSVQGNETEFARDTSDTSTNTWVSSSEGDNISVHVEYELDSQSEEENNLVVESSSSEPENYLAVGLVDSLSSDLADLADDSDDSLSSEDSEIKKADYWSCVQCENPNNNPLFRYCEKCYQVRRTHFGRTRRKRKQKETLGSEASRKSFTLKASQDLIEMDSGIGSSQELRGSSLSSLENLSRTAKATSQCESDIERLSPLTILSKKLDIRQKEASNGNILIPKNDTNSSSSGVNDGLCLICTTNPKNGIFVHGKISHICCCYQCAKKVWQLNKNRCPICQRKVSQVLKAFYV